ncbi:MAG: heavy metal translocating P-type ATPase [Gemmatimonadota bacterium]|nr:MAG: heavy metal translocating P-type ATPase [Gemmatimonadota bacterium]
MTERSTRALEEATSARFVVADMDCASCAQKIQRHLLKVEGVLTAEVSPIARTLSVDLDPGRTTAEEVREEVGRLGYVARPFDEAGATADVPGTWRSPPAQIAYASLGLFSFAMLLRALGLAPVVLTLPFRTLLLPDLLLLASALVGGWNFFPKGARAARSLALDMNFLMTVAIIGAVAVGELPEAAAIAFLFAIAELLESYSADRARASVEALMDLAPDSARVERDGVEVAIPAEEVVTGDVILLRPGERVPADGTVEEGVSAVDQSPITGESVPVDKGPGDDVFSGTINRGGFLRIRATKPAADSALARIVRLVEQAGADKSPTEAFIERFARYYTPAVTLAAVLLMTVPPIVFGAPFDIWFVRALTLLVIACPCALVISTPVAVVSGVTAAARNGVLIKGGRYLEAMGDIDVVALDKTGTLTIGHPRVVAVLPSGNLSEEEVLAHAAAIEAHSEHPIARAIVDAARDRGARWDGWTVTDFAAEVGSGARARVDGVEYVIGKLSEFVSAGRYSGQPADFAAGGRTVVGLASQGEVLAWFALADEPREAATTAVAGLRRAGIRRMVMLTGDNQETAEAVGRSVGVDEVRADLLPEGKVDAIRALEAEYGAVAMVGDGVNDGPALAVATVGIAMGAAGSDTALETADIALMGDDLTRLPYLYELSHQSRNVIRQNITLAIVVKAILALGVPLGMVSLVTAVVLGDLGVSLGVTLNALRLARVEA